MEKTKIDNFSLIKPDNSDSSSNMFSNEISIMEILITLWKKKWIIIICTVLVIILGIIYSYTIQKEYTTETKFVVKTSRNTSNSLSQIASLAGFSLGNGVTTDPSEYLKDILDDKIFISGLYEKKWYYEGDSLCLDKIFMVKFDSTVSNWEHRYYMSKLETIRKKRSINIRKDSKTGIVTLTVKMPDAQLAYDLNIYVIDYLSQYLKHYLKSQAKEKRDFIEKRIEEAKTDLIRSEDQLSRFRERNMMSSSPSLAVEEMRLTRQLTINQEIFIELKKQYEIAKMEELDDQSLVQTIKNPDIPAWRSKPNRYQIVVIFSFLGMVLGIGITLTINPIKLLISAINKK